MTTTNYLNNIEINNETIEIALKCDYDGETYNHDNIVRWFRIKHNMNVRCDFLPNIQKYRASFIPMDIIPKQFIKHTDYIKSMSQFYSNKNFDIKDYDLCLEYAIQKAFNLIYKNKNI